MNTSNASVCPKLYLSDPRCHIFNLINFCVIWVILGLFGTIGNLLSIATLIRDSRRNVSSLLLASLAVSDSIQIWTIVLIHSISDLCTYSNIYSVACEYKYYVWPYVWKYVRPIWLFGILMSNWITVLVTFHRTIAVTRPHKARVVGTIARVRLQCLCVMVGAIIMSIPKGFDTRIESFPGCIPDIDINMYMPVFSHPIYIYFYQHVLLNGFGKILPVVMLIVLTSLLLITIRKGSRQGSFLGRRGPDTIKQERQLTILLIVVVLVFLMCQLPHVIIMYLPMGRQCPSTGYYIQALTDTLSVVNASVNFALYCMIGKKFRRMLRELWSCPAAQMPMSPHQDSTRTRLTVLSPSPDTSREKLNSLLEKGENHLVTPPTEDATESRLTILPQGPDTDMEKSSLRSHSLKA